MSGEWETVERSHPRWRSLAKPMGLVAVGAVAAALFLSGSGDAPTSLVVGGDERPAGDAEEATPGAPSVPGDWQTMAAGPLRPRQEPASAWTGTELVVWGGRMRGRLGTFADGAAYEPIGDRWRELPPSPLSPRGSAASVWTGTEFVIWGGAGDRPEGTGDRYPLLGVPLADGAAYNPTTNAWRKLARSPLAARHDAQAVWIDGVVVIWGGASYRRGPHFTDGAVYDPAEDTWTPLPRSPLEGRSDTEIDVVAVDNQMFVLASSSKGIATALYDPARGRWVPGIGAPPLRGDLPAAMATVGDSVLVWGQVPPPQDSPMAFLYTPSDQTWRTVDRPPRPPYSRDELAAAGHRAVAWQRDVGLVFDAPTGRWTPMPEAPPLRYGVTVQEWTGDRLLFWNSAATPTDATRAVAWVPAETW